MSRVPANAKWCCPPRFGLLSPLTQQIMEALAARPDEAMRIIEVCDAIGLPRSEAARVNNALTIPLLWGWALKVGRGRYAATFEGRKGTSEKGEEKRGKGEGVETGVAA